MTRCSGPNSRRRGTRRGTTRRSKLRLRSGVTYVAVLGVSLVVATLGMAAVLATQVDVRRTGAAADSSGARLHALTAIEMGQLAISQDPQWRSNRSNGSWYQGAPVSDPASPAGSSGNYSLEVVNPSGDLNRSETDAVDLTASGGQGQSRYRVGVTLTPQVVPYTCLNAALSAGDTIYLASSRVYAYNQIIASNNTIYDWFGAVEGHLEAVTAIGWITGSGGRTTGVKPRTFPSSSVFDYYVQRGTPISMTSLPSGSSGRVIENIVLSPANNPYGTRQVNAQGIYVIDCGGQALSIRNSRIVGTLVLRNVTADSILDDSLYWEPAVSNYPCLLAQGSLQISCESSGLSEGSTNFNPSGTPYPWGSTNQDNDTSDSYPSLLKGLVYVSHDAVLTDSPAIGQLVVGDDVTSYAQVTLEYSSRYFGDPPPGFYTIKMTPSSGTWRRLGN